MRFEHLEHSDFQIPEGHLCGSCGYEPVFSAHAKCDVCLKLEQFTQFASEIHDIFGTIGAFSRTINDALMEVENEIYDNPGLNIEAEKRRIRARVAEKIQRVLLEFGLDS